MVVVASLRHGLRLLVPLAIACTVYLYLYPVFNGCAFPIESRNRGEAFAETKKLHWPFASSGSGSGSGSSGGDDGENHNDVKPVLPTRLAPFRLLALGDPQLEGDTSIPTTHHGVLPHLKRIVNHVTFKTSHSSIWERMRVTTHELVDFYFEDIPNLLESGRKRFDLVGNDYYLGHIYRTLYWWTKPTHVSILGDLLGSQWINDAEFERRADRFWNRTFKGAERLSDDLAMWPKSEYVVSGVLNETTHEDWSRKLLNVAGNHDIGYAGDLTRRRLDRFERRFGKVNYELRFELPVTDPAANASIVHPETNPDSTRLVPELRIVVVNDMNLDTPARDSSLQDATYDFINTVIGTSSGVEYQGHFTLVLTHIPMHKPAGICVDAPFFDFHGGDGGGVKEQNLLSYDASKGFLEGLFGVSANHEAAGGGQGRPGLMLNGHDHEGCDTFHYVNHTHGESADDRLWQATRWLDAVGQGLPAQPGSFPGRREITVRSMMGGFGGNAGLLSMWFDQDAWEWRYEYDSCPLGTQHFWWLAHILDFVALLGLVVYGLLAALVAAGVDVDGALCRSACWVARSVGIVRRTVPAAKTVDKS